MITITATQSTALKRAPIDSSRQKPTDVIQIEAGRSLSVESVFTIQNNHCKLKLAFQGWTEAFVFGPHWKIPTGQDLGLVGSLKPKSQGLFTRIVPSKKDYVLQPDPQTCQSACIAMITGGDVWAIREALTKGGQVAGDPAVMGEYLSDRVKEYKFLPSASLNDARRAIDEGYQLITHTYYSGSGHVIKLSGYEVRPDSLNYQFVVDDPWAEFDAKGWTYAPWDKQGNNARYSAHSMYAAAIVGQSVYDAAEVYRRGELDSNREGAWLHLIKT
jgi:hypothetical protein